MAEDSPALPGTASTSTLNTSLSQPCQAQPRIDDVLHQQAKEAYRKLIRTAYLLAVDGQPLTVFQTLVNIQKANGTCQANTRM